MSTRRPVGAGSVSRAVQKGWRIERIPGRPLRVDNGRLVLPLWLVKDGEHVSDVESRLSLAEAEQLYGDLGDTIQALRELSDRPAVEGVPS